MKLKNYRSESTRTFEIIQQCLIDHKARQIVFEYADNGTIKAIAFSLEMAGKLHAFRLPARVEQVERVLYGSNDLSEAKKEQAYRTAWANIRDWLTAQMALLDTQMVKAEEIFLPYMLTKQGQTYFEALEQKHFQLESGKNTE